MDNITCLASVYTFAQMRLTENLSLMRCLSEIYGSMVMDYHRWLMKFAQCDSILFKLALALFSVLSNGRVYHQDGLNDCSNVRSIVEIGDRYGEVVWKYLLYKDGHDGAVKKYMWLIRWFLALSVLVYYVRGNKRHVYDVHGMVEETEIELLLNDDD